MKYAVAEIPSDALTVAIEAARELTRARSKFHAFAGPHEGYAVILEELDELWDLVRAFPKRSSVDQMRSEAIQIAAMALRFIVDVCDAEKPA